jgi:hypothetical protein
VSGSARDEAPRTPIFGTTTYPLNALADRQTEHGVESAAMETAYVYWISIYELLKSQGIEVVLVDARPL